MISYFLTAREQTLPAEADAFAELRTELARIPQLRFAELHRPAGVETYHRDGAAPRAAMRLVFDSIEALESQLMPGARLLELTGSALWRHVAGEQMTQQAMLTRTYLPSGRVPIGADSEETCSYLVHYPGRAEDLNAWLRYYVNHHPQIMLDYPDVMQVQVFTCLDWCDAMPFERVSYMQRNQLTFPSIDALMCALESPVRARMRADNQNFPEFTGGATHFAMRTSFVNGI
ncbi:ethyl tert-butyl ether degradation protein EthD [Paraburkholderia dipogonis]|uniref:Ethyl tert-butyl ether degradation protein EthD n=1 Tax=Paraburkholderia dipogonis TaxID=1211383 RepID=A0A4Y8MT44_9BURK|nr:ethyl tert-butyl ether degradation protein EthD [Paraburkholderia dipogonis]TFE40483.1 ethyl tert-butyl ether degradation protein EthD [Paraburkholderia dipogonis]